MKNCLIKGLIPSLKIAGQWQFKKDVIDKWITEESLERVTQSIKSSLKKKVRGNNYGKGKGISKGNL